MKVNLGRDSNDSMMDEEEENIDVLLDSDLLAGLLFCVINNLIQTFLSHITFISNSIHRLWCDQ